MRIYLTWLVLACLLPGVIGALTLFFYDYHQGRTQLERNTVQTARALMQAVDTHMLRVEAVAQALAASDALAAGDFARFHQQAQRVIARAGLGSGVVLRDARGLQLLNTAVAYGSPLPTIRAEQQVRQVFTAGRPTISDLFNGPLLQRPLMSLDVPVFIDGKVRYALGVAILPEQINAILVAQGLPADWIANVMDRTGTIVGRTHAAEEYIGQKAAPEMFLPILRQREGSVDAVTVEGMQVVSFFSRSALSGWSVAIGIPGQTLTGKTLSFLAGGIALLFAIGLLLAGIMAERMATAIRSLIRPAAALGEGGALAVPPVAVEEAAELAQAIRRAGELLRNRARSLRAKEAELDEVHRLARFGTWYWDLRSGEMETSESMAAIFGRRLLPFQALQGAAPDVGPWERLRAATDAARRSGTGYDLELRVLHAAGHPMWVSAKCEVVRNGHGEVVALRGALQDISERKEAIEGLRESEARFRLLADNIAQLAWIADAAGNITWYNRRWFEFTGTTLEQVRGWGWQRVHHPEHIDRVVGKFRRHVESGEPWEDTFPLRGVDGEYRWFLSRAVPERDAGGAVTRWFGTNTDVTAQRQTEEELGKFKFFSDHANDIHLLLDADGRIRYANVRASERLAYDADELLGLHYWDIDMTFTAERFRAMFGHGREVLTPSFEGAARRRDGSTFPIETTAVVHVMAEECLMFAAARDISERRLAEQRVRDAALHDSLTGLPNRALVFEYCERMLAAAQRNHSHGALLFVDLDRFKPVNDMHGHDVGDKVLQEIAQRLVAVTRHEDLVGRLGGDEFVIVLPYIESDRRRAAVVAQHVVETVSRPVRVGALVLSVSPSIGISYFPDNAADVGALLHTADMAMYQAKSSGRANFQFYTPELDERAEQAMRVEILLRQALERDRLALYYQPVVDVRSGRLVGAEVLLRLPLEGGEAIGPDRFIPVAESAGLIVELGDWVARRACRQQAAWRRDLGWDIALAINVSPLQFRQKHFADKLATIIADAGIDPARLEIEVTESTVMESVDEAIKILKDIKALGVKVALDDFGTGYSSLASLSSLPLDKLKVDQSFVRRIEGDPASRAVTEAIIALGRSLHLEVHGEGIESAGTLDYLRAHGCDQAQGYWFSRPLPADDFLRWCRAQEVRVAQTA